MKHPCHRRAIASIFTVSNSIVHSKFLPFPLFFLSHTGERSLKDRTCSYRSRVTKKDIFLLEFLNRNTFLFFSSCFNLRSRIICIRKWFWNIDSAEGRLFGGILIPRPSLVFSPRGEILIYTREKKIKFDARGGRLRRFRWVVVWNFVYLWI